MCSLLDEVPGGGTRRVTAIMKSETGGGEGRMARCGP